MNHTLAFACQLLERKCNKKITPEHILQAANNGSLLLCILYDGKASTYYSNGDDLIENLYGWFVIPPRFLADLINNQSVAVNMLVSANKWYFLHEGISSRLIATKDNIYISDDQLSELINLNTSNSQDSSSRRQNQLTTINDIIRLQNLEPTKLPNGSKASIKIECLNKYPQLFTKDGFDHAWKEGSKQQLFGMENKEKFSKGRQ